MTVDHKNRRRVKAGLGHTQRLFSACAEFNLNKDHCILHALNSLEQEQSTFYTSGFHSPLLSARAVNRIMRCLIRHSSPVCMLHASDRVDYCGTGPRTSRFSHSKNCGRTANKATKSLKRFLGGDERPELSGSNKRTFAPEWAYSLGESTK